MQIYIDGLFYKAGGIGRYFESLAKELARKGVRIFTTLPESCRHDFKNDFRDLSNIMPTFVKYKKFSIKGFFFRSLLLLKLRTKCHVFLFPHINLPWFVPENTFVTIHDLLVNTPFWSYGEISRRLFRLALQRALYKAQKIICVSNTTRDELLKFYPWLKEKTIVIREFVDHKFFDIPPMKPLIEKPYILWVGNRMKHKNIRVLLKSFSMANKIIPHFLVMVGPKEYKWNSSLQKSFECHGEHRIIEFMNIGDQELINLYRFADLFIFPSLYEGFGLPPLEAVTCGCPVVISDIPIFREIFQEKGEYFNPNSPEELSHILIRLLSDNNARIDLYERQKSVLQLYDREKIVQDYLILFSEGLRYEGASNQ